MSVQLEFFFNNSSSFLPIAGSRCLGFLCLSGLGRGPIGGGGGGGGGRDKAAPTILSSIFFWSTVTLLTFVSVSLEFSEVCISSVTSSTLVSVALESSEVS